MELGFVRLGRMGSAMAANLLEARTSLPCTIAPLPRPSRL